MVEAVITWKGGDTVTVHARGFRELFAAIGDREIEAIDAYEISIKEIRQGRCASLGKGT